VPVLESSWQNRRTSYRSISGCARYKKQARDKVSRRENVVKRIQKGTKSEAAHLGDSSRQGFNVVPTFAEGNLRAAQNGKAVRSTPGVRCRHLTTHLQSPGPKAVSKVLHLWVGHQSPGHIPDTPLELSDSLVLAKFTQKTTFLSKRIFLVVFWVTVVGI
jgi:hypothetical protein